MSTGWQFLLIVLVLLILIKCYNVLKTKRCASKVCLVGKTVIVTGSNTGIGYEAALEFATRGARVILACRDLEKAEKAKNKIINQSENTNIVVKKLDLSSLQSVKDFAKNIIENENRLDILVNNAGGVMIKHKFTQDGLELLMQINYFGSVLLTILLLGLLKKAAPSRIINVSSCLALLANLTAKNINEPPKNVLFNYANSKLGNILFTIKLAELLRGSGVSVFSLHPGFIETEIFRRFSGFQDLIFKVFLKMYSKTSEEGAQTTIYTALEQGLERYSGEHFEECTRTSTYPNAKDCELIEGVWKRTIDLLGCEKDVAEHLT